MLDHNHSGSIETHEFEAFLKHGGAFLCELDDQASSVASAEREATQERDALLPQLSSVVGGGGGGGVSGVGRRRRAAVESNPRAGDVRARELEAPFLKTHVRETRVENKRAEAVAREKLAFELAKQTQQGLAKTLGVQYEMTSIANLVRLALQNEHLSAAEIDALPNAHLVHKSKDVLKHVRSYDLNKVAQLLEIQIVRVPTWGTATTTSQRG